MRFIDKANVSNKEKGETWVHSFLNEWWNNDVDFPKDLYGSFRDKGKLRQLLLAEQNNRCCYCQRKLELAEVTLEHLIPNKASKDEFNKYPREDNELTHVCFAQDFINLRCKKLSKFPHTIAYQNLTASCDGKIAGFSLWCNNKRGDKFVAPFILYSSIEEDIQYKTNGEVRYLHEKNMIPSVNILGLNDETLRFIRLIWLYAQRKQIVLQEVDDRDSFLKQVNKEMKIIEKNWEKLTKFNLDSYWNFMLKYDYFYTVSFVE